MSVVMPRFLRSDEVCSCAETKRAQPPSAGEARALTPVRTRSTASHFLMKITNAVKSVPASWMVTRRSLVGLGPSQAFHEDNQPLASDIHVHHRLLIVEFTVRTDPHLAALHYGSPFTSFQKRNLKMVTGNLWRIIDRTAGLRASVLECGDLSPLWLLGRLVGKAEPRAAAPGGFPTRGTFDGDRSPAESGDKSPHSKTLALRSCAYFLAAPVESAGALVRTITRKGRLVSAGSSGG